VVNGANVVVEFVGDVVVGLVGFAVVEFVM